MAPNNTINARIALEGGADITRAFSDIRDAVTAALAQIQAAMQRINLTIPGADQAKAQLAAVGQAGEQAAGQVKTAFDSVGPSMQAAGQAAQSAGGQITAAGGQAQQSAANIASSFSTAASSVGSALLKIGAGIAALALAGNAIAGKLAKDFADTTDGLNDNAKAANLGVAAYQRLKTHADEAGLSETQFGDALSTVKKIASDFANGAAVDLGGGMTAVTKKVQTLVEETHGQLGPVLADATVTTLRMGQSAETAGAKFSDTAAKLRQFGIAVADVVGKNPDQILQLLATRYSDLSSETQKAAFAQAFFGKNAKDVEPLLKAGGEALKKQSEDAREFTAAQIKSGVDLKKGLDDLSEAIKFAKNLIGSLFAPSATAKAEWLTNLIDGARKMVTSFLDANGLKDKLLAGKFDFFKDFDLDKFQAFLNDKGQGGLATALEFVRGVSADLANLWTNVLVPAGQAVLGAFDTIAGKINEVFGTQISGRFIAVATVVGLITGAFGLLAGAIAPIVGLLAGLLGPFAALAPLIVAVGGALALAFTNGVPAIETFKQKLLGIGIDIDALKSTILTFLSSSWRDLVAAFQGRDLDVQNPFFIALRDFIIGLPGLIVVAVAAFTLFRRAIIGITPLINQIFGTKFTASQVGLISIIGTLTGAFSGFATALVAVAALTTILFNGFSLLAAILGPIAVALAAFLGLPVFVVGAIAAAFAGLVAAVVVYWDQIKATALAAWNAITVPLAAAIEAVKQKLAEARAVLGEIFGGGDPVDNAWAWLSRQLAAEWERIKADVARELENVKKLFGVQNGDTLWTWLTRSLDNELAAIERDIQNMIDQVKSLIDKIKEAASAGGGIAPPNFPTDQGIPGLGPGSTPFGIAGQGRGQGGFLPNAPASTNIEDRRAELDGIEAGAKAVLDQLAALAGDVATQVAAAFSQLSDAATSAMETIVATFTGGGDLIVTILTGAFQRVADGVRSTVDALSTALQSVFTALQTAVDATASQIDAAISAVIAKLEAAVAKARELAAAANSAGGGGGGSTQGSPASDGFAAGGYTGGIAHRIAGVVHGEEYVQPAHVVRQPGVLGFLEVLRRSGGDLHAAIGRFARGYDFGGLVGNMSARLNVPVPGFAGGGFVHAPATLPHHGTVDFNLGGGRSVRMIATTDAVGQLKAALDRARLVSNGAPPRGGRF